MIRTGYGRLSNLSRDPGQRWCGVASVKPHRTALLADRTALIAGWRDPTPATETRSHAEKRVFDPMHESALVCMVISTGHQGVAEVLAENRVDMAYPAGERA
jgi:hypothetical protein